MVFLKTLSSLEGPPGETSEEKLIRLLNNHDWYYHMSDDHRVWARGDAEVNNINSLVKLLGNKGTDLYNKHKPTIS